MAKKPKPPKPPKPKKIHGHVTAINLDPPELTLRVKHDSVSYSVSSDAKFTLNKLPAAFSDIAVGDNVFLTLDAAGMAKTIDARREDDEDSDI